MEAVDVETVGRVGEAWDVGEGHLGGGNGNGKRVWYR